VGVALELDYERALANLERIRQDLADAVLMRDLAARNLETLSGISPTPATAYPEDDLRGEGDIAEWLATKETPMDRVQQRLTLAAASGRRAAASVLLPTLSVNGQQRFTNAAGFVGRTEYYTLQAVLSWRLDYGTFATAKAQAAAAEVQNIVSERMRRGLEDSIYDAYKRVEAGLAKSASARLQAAAARKAADLAVARYGVGAVTQLDVTQSQREAFQAEAGRIGADADLAYARALLRTAAGKPVDESHVRTSSAVPSAAEMPPLSPPGGSAAKTTPPPDRSQP
jgi:outer membrane protein